MKTLFKRSLSFILCIAVVTISCLGMTSMAVDKTDNTDVVAKPESDAAVVATGSSATKDETVYVIAGSDGAAKNIIVSDWIKNSPKDDVISDTSILKDIENVKGDETYTLDGNNKLSWNAKGNDIYYQGTTDKQLPVTIAVSYKLDGNPISASELVGKSGKVTIRYTYTNNQFENIEIAGKQEKVYVPFVVLTGMMMDNNIFTDIEVSNGKLINDGTNSTIIGYALPGMQENLGISKDKYEVPSYVEITANADKFSYGDTLTMVTSELFSTLPDETDKDGISSLTGSLSGLVGGLSQLSDGTSELYNGLCTLMDKTDTLVSGVNKLSNGLSTASSHSSELNSGAKQIFESVLSTAEAQIKAKGVSISKLTVDNYSKVLTDVINSLDKSGIVKKVTEEARKKVSEAVNAERATIRNAVVDVVKEEVTNKVNAAARAEVKKQVCEELGYDEAAFDNGTLSVANQVLINLAISLEMASSKVTTLINQNIEAQINSAEVNKIIEDNTNAQVEKIIDEKMQSDEVQKQILEALKSTESGVSDLVQLKSQLDKVNLFYKGLKDYTSGVDQAAAGAKELNDNMPALKDGVSKLKDGAQKLNDGVKQFSSDGMKELLNSVDGDLDGIVDKLEAMITVAGNYKSFSGLTEGMNGSVKFIYRIEAVK